MGNAPQGRFYELDSLRGIAAVAVVVFHYQFDFFDRANYTTAYPFPKGYLAVDLFFVLSGVVLAYRYGQELRSGTLPVWRFMFARLTRLYPLHLATLLFIAASVLLAGQWGDTDVSGGGTPTFAFVLNLLLIQCIGLLPSATFNIVSWSISTEIVVNGFYAAIARYTAKGLAHVLMVLAGAGSLVLLIMTPNLPHYLSVMYEHSFGGIAAGVLRCIFGFMIGVVFYRTLIATKLHERVSPAADRVRRSCAGGGGTCDRLWRRTVFLLRARLRHRCRRYTGASVRRNGRADAPQRAASPSRAAFSWTHFVFDLSASYACAQHARSDFPTDSTISDHDPARHGIHPGRVRNRDQRFDIHRDRAGRPDTDAQAGEAASHARFLPRDHRRPCVVAASSPSIRFGRQASEPRIRSWLTELSQGRSLERSAVHI
jgi:hypothetical protein